MKPFLHCFVVCSLLYFIKAQSISVQCGNNTTKEKFMQDLPADKVQLGDNYEVTIRYTNWQNGFTAKFVEQNYNGTIVLTKTTRQAIHILYDALNESSVYYKENLTQGNAGYECHGKPTNDEKNFYDLPLIFANFLGVNNTYASFSSILSAISFYKGYNSSKEEVGNIFAGVETIGWLGCADNVTQKNDTIQVNIYFSGEHSKVPYNNEFNNPQVYTIHLHALKVNNSNFTISDHISFDVVTLDKVNLDEREFVLTPPRGKYCQNIPKSDIPHGFPSHFKASLQYFDGTAKFVDNVEIVYDKTERIFSFAANFNVDKDIPFIGKTSITKNALVVHDFTYGFQYVLSRNSSVCHNVGPIDSNMGDVNAVNGTLYIRDPSEVLFNCTDTDEFYYAGKVKGDNDIVLDSFVSKKSLDKDGIVICVELLYISNSWSLGGSRDSRLHSIVQYHTHKSGDIFHQTTIRFNSLLNSAENSGETSWVSNNVYPCLNSYKEDEFFFITLTNITLDEMKSVGLDRVENSLIETIAHVANISVLRLTNFMFAQLHDKLLACFIVSEKNKIEPAKTAYLKKELSVDEVHRALNESINSTNTLTIKIPTGDNKHFLVITSNEFGQLPIHDLPMPTPSFVGYSGSSMFVLGLFMFIFGASCVIGSYVLYMKRQRIRGIAYQVFE